VCILSLSLSLALSLVLIHPLSLLVTLCRERADAGPVINVD
jgi:hypothetical protein